MEPATLSLNTELVQRELAELDRLVHRIQARLMPAQKPREDHTREILRRTAGALRHKINPDEVVAWQRKIRAEWVCGIQFETPRTRDISRIIPGAAEGCDTIEADSTQIATRNHADL